MNDQRAREHYSKDTFGVDSTGRDGIIVRTCDNKIQSSGIVWKNISRTLKSLNVEFVRQKDRKVDKILLG